MTVFESLSKPPQPPTTTTTSTLESHNNQIPSPTSSNESVSPLSTEPLFTTTNHTRDPFSIPYLPINSRVGTQFSLQGGIRPPTPTAPEEFVLENESSPPIMCHEHSKDEIQVPLEADASQEESIGALVDFPMYEVPSNDHLKYVTKKKGNTSRLLIPSCCIPFAKYFTIIGSVCLSVLIALACLAFFVASVYVYVRVDVGNFNIPKSGTLLAIQCNETTALCKGVVRVDPSSASDERQPPPPDISTQRSNDPMFGKIQTINSVLDSKTLTSEDEYPYDCNVWNDAKRGIYSIPCYFNKNLSKMTLYPVVNFDDQALLISSCVMIVFIPILCLLQNLFVIRWLCCGNIHGKNKQNVSS
ncbi:hypothetical protein C9374_003599 [Naegleria lovaniensis]|uniref:Uncharacterized protein n=1 Tax=Naegleria lovaniensis TaxID=51637 RepID=A0AA88KYA7_NAELO|nr:uncharacterized protein C9374_003599 [Naegleria lovaniensis]KAG2393835.1 hypothetical protein C9374_003599 [Naegleria lovaniensis]